jgi:ribosome-associated protein
LSAPEDGSEVDPRRLLRVSPDLSIGLSEITFRTSRSSGPGGQHANVTASRVEAVFDVAASPSLSDSQRERLLARIGARATAVAQDERSQARNRELATARLAQRLADALKVSPRRQATRPTRAARAQRLTDKRLRSQRKQQRRPPGSDGD